MAGEVKTFEIRDEGTFIPVLAVRLDPQCEQDRYLYARAGYGLNEEEQGRYVILWRLNGGEANHDPYGWEAGTMRAAHAYIAAAWADLKSGQVIDVEFIGGQSKTPKESERTETTLA